MRYEQYLSHAAMPGTLEPTSGDIEGPFYKDGAQFRDDISEGESGRFLLRGKVKDTEGKDVEGAVLDFWQASPSGEYDQEGFRFRGKVENRCHTRTGDHEYKIRTVTPGCYEISDTESRCPHIHVKVTAPGYKPLTTQLYFPNGEHNNTDRWFSPGRVLQRRSRTSELWHFDFVLEREGTG